MEVDEDEIGTSHNLQRPNSSIPGDATSFQLRSVLSNSQFSFIRSTNSWDVQNTSNLPEGLPPAAEHPIDVSSRNLRNATDGSEDESAYSDWVSSNSDDQGTETASVTSSQMQTFDADTQSNSDSSSILHEIRNAPIQRHFSSGTTEENRDQDSFIFADHETNTERIGSRRGNTSDRGRFQIIGLKDVLCSREHLSAFLRITVVFIGAITPLLLEMCTLRDPLSQFLDRSSWILVRATSNPTLLKHDVVIPIPRELMEHATLLASEGRCFGDSDRDNGEKDGELRTSTRRSNNEALTKRRDVAPTTERRQQGFKPNKNFEGFKSTSENIQSGFFSSPFLKSIQDENYNRFLTLSQLLHDKTSLGLDVSKRFDLVLIITGKRRRQKNNNEALCSHTRTCGNGEGNNEENVEGNVGINSVKALYMTDDNHDSENRDLTGEGSRNGTAAFRGSKSRNRTFQIRESEVPIACPIRLTPRLCQSRIFLNALQHFDDVCQFHFPSDAIHRWRGTFSWNGILHDWNSLYGFNPILTGWSGLNDRATFNVAKMPTSNFQTRQLIWTTSSEQGKPDEAFAPKSRNSLPRAFASQHQCVKPNAALENLSKVNTQFRDAIHSFHDGGSSSTERGHAYPADNGAYKRSSASAAQKPATPSSSSVGVLLASTSTDDVTLPFVFRLVAVVFVFAQWITVEMRMVVEMFLPPALMAKVIAGCILFPFRAFQKYLGCYLKLLKWIGSQCVRMVCGLQDSFGFRRHANQRIVYGLEPANDDNVNYRDNEREMRRHTSDDRRVPIHTRLTLSEFLEMDPHLASLHAIWRTVNFCLHYLWASITTVCLHCIVTDGLTLQWRLAVDLLTISELCLVQKLAWFAWALVIAVIHLYKNSIKFQLGFTDMTRLERPLGRRSAQDSGTLLSSARRTLWAVATSIWCIIGAYSVATVIIIFSLGLLKASLLRVSLFMAFSLAETLLRVVLGLEVPFSRRRSTRTRFQHSSELREANLVNVALRSDFRLTAQQRQVEDLRFSLDTEDDNRENEEETSVHNGEPLMRLSTVNLPGTTELVGDHTVGGLELLGIPWMRLQRCRSRRSTAARMNSEYRTRQTTRIGNRRDLLVGTGLFIVEKTGFNCFKVVDPDTVESNYASSTQPDAGNNWNSPTLRIFREPSSISDFQDGGDKSKEHQQSLSMCYVCMSNSDDAILIPCMHGGICLSCGRTILLNAIVRKITGKCPLCRTGIYALGQVVELLSEAPISVNDNGEVSSLQSMEAGKYEQDQLDNDQRRHNSSQASSSSYQLLRVVLTIPPYTSATTAADFTFNGDYQ